MPKLSLENLTSQYASISQLNANFQAIEDYINQEALSRTNSAGEDNFMDSDLDMNSYRILNLPEPLSSNEPVRLVDLNEAIFEGVDGLVPIEQPRQLGDGVTTTFSTPATGSIPAALLHVRLNGSVMRANTEFTYNSSTGDITFVDGAPNLNAEIDVTYFKPALISTAYSTTADITHKGNSLEAEVDARVPTVATLGELQAVDAAGFTGGERRDLTHPTRGGRFRFVTSDISALVAIDPLQGHIVPPSSDVTGASGGWLRDTYGEAWVEEFGAVGDYNPVAATGTNSTAAVQACYDFCVQTGRTMRAGSGTFRVDELDLDTGWTWNGSSYDNSYFTGFKIEGTGTVDSMAFTGEAGLRAIPTATIFYSTVTTAGRSPFKTNFQQTGDIQYIFNALTHSYINNITFVADVPEFVLETGINNLCEIGEVSVINENNTAGSGVFLKNAFFSDATRLLIRTADRDYFTVNTGIGLKYQNRIATAGITANNNALVEGFRIAYLIDGNGDQGATPANGSGIDNIALKRANAQKCQYGIVARTTRSNLFTLDIRSCYFERLKYTAVDISGNMEQYSVKHCKFPMHLFAVPQGDVSGLTVNTTTSAGAITSATVNAGGSKYTVGDQVTVSGGGGNAVLTIDAVTGKGVATAVSVSNGGSGYSNATGAATTVNIISKGVVIGDAADKWGQAAGSGTEAETASAGSYTQSGARAGTVSENMFYITADTQGLVVENSAQGLRNADNDYHATGTLNANSIGSNYNGRPGLTERVIEDNNSYIGTWTGGTKTTASNDADIDFMSASGKTRNKLLSANNFNLVGADRITADTFSDAIQIREVDATSGNVVCTLPAVATAEGRRYVRVKVDSSANYVAFRRNAADAGTAYIRGNGSTTTSIEVRVSTQFGALTVECINGQWYVTASSGTIAYV